MALDSYSSLKTAIQDWMARSDLSGNVADWITLAEARLNRTLNPVEVDQSLTGTVDSRRLDVSSYSIVSPIALFVTDPSTSDEREITPRSDGTFEYISTSGQPRFWAMDASQDYVDLDRPCDVAYAFRFRYRQRFALSNSVTTNWLLDNYPDLYLAASIMWGGAFTQNMQSAATFKAVLDEGIPEVRNVIARNKRGVLTVDPALVARPRPGTYQGVDP